MAPRSKSILRPPDERRIVRPTAEVISGYLEALEEECQKVLRSEFPFDTDEAHIQKCMDTEIRTLKIRIAKGDIR